MAVRWCSPDEAEISKKRTAALSDAMEAVSLSSTVIPRKGGSQSD